MRFIQNTNRYFHWIARDCSYIIFPVIPKAIFLPVILINYRYGYFLFLFSEVSVFFPSPQFYRYARLFFIPDNPDKLLSFQNCTIVVKFLLITGAVVYIPWNTDYVTLKNEKNKNYEFYNNQWYNHFLQFLPDHRAIFNNGCKCIDILRLYAAFGCI